MIPRDFHFAALNLFWNILWLLPFLIVLFYSFYKKMGNAYQLVQKPLRSPLLSNIKIFAFVLGWIFATLALMNPVGNEYYPLSQSDIPTQNSLDLYLVIDVSQSMDVRDLRNKKSRLEAAEEIVDQLVARLKSDPVALFVFTSQLMPLVPLTLDRTFLRLMLTEIQFNPENHFGTHFEPVLRELKLKIFEEYPKAPKAVILFSDGEDTDLSPNVEPIFVAAKDLGVPVFTVGLGTKEGAEVPEQKVISKIDESLLEEISKQTGGEYFLGTKSSAEDVASELDTALQKYRLNRVSEERGGDGIFHYYFQVPLLASILLFAVFWIFPAARGITFLLLVAGTYAENIPEASSWYFEELKSLPPEWLRNKLLYNLGTSLMAEKKEEESRRAFFAISKEAYSHPLFRSRLIYNQALAAEASHKPYLLQKALFLLQLSDVPQEDLKNQLKVSLSDLEGEYKITPEEHLNMLIDLVRLAANLSKPSLFSLESLFPEGKEFESAKDDFKKALTDPSNQSIYLQKVVLALLRIKEKMGATPSSFLQAAIDETAIVSALDGSHQQLGEDGSRFYPLSLAWQQQQFAKGICQRDPWRQVIPAFTKGLIMLQVPLNSDTLFYTYNQWVEALNLLQKAQGKTTEVKNEDLTELRWMQALDKMPEKPKMKPIGEKKPW